MIIRKTADRKKTATNGEDKKLVISKTTEENIWEDVEQAQIPGREPTSTEGHDKGIVDILLHGIDSYTGKLGRQYSMQ